MLSPTVMLQQIVNFLLLMVLLTHLLYRPVGNILRERRERIEAELNEADRQRNEARAFNEASQKELHQVHQEAREILERAARQGTRSREEAAAAARRDAKLYLERARENLDRERAQVWEELQGDLADLTILTAARIIGNVLDEESHERLVEELVITLEGEA